MVVEIYKIGMLIFWYEYILCANYDDWWMMTNGTTMHGNKSVMLVIFNEKCIKAIEKLKIFHQVKKKLSILYWVLVYVWVL